MKLNLKKLSLLASFLVMTLGITLESSYASGSRYNVDKDESRVQWIGRRIGSSHDGHVKILSGHLTVDGQRITGGEFTINMTSITVDDIKDSDRNARLVGHLKNDDFFSVDKFSEAKLVIKNSEVESSGMQSLSGDLTIKGITKPISFKAEVKLEGDTVQAKSQIIFDRTDYGIRYRSGNFFQDLGDRAINDDIEINVQLTAKK